MSNDSTVRAHLNGQATRNDQQLNNLNSLAASFPKVIRKLLLFLPSADLKSARQCSESLRRAVDQYIGLNFCLYEVDPKYSRSNVELITSEMLDSFKTLGIRYIPHTPFSSLFAFPHLLQSLGLLGTFNTNTLLQILTQCWNLQELKFQENNEYRYDELFVTNFEKFMRTVNEHGNIRLPNLKRLRWKGVSTTGFLLVLVSVIEAKNLQRLLCFYCPISPDHIPLVIGTLAHAMDIAAKTLKEFVFLIEKGSFESKYYKISTKVLNRDLCLLTDQGNLLQLPTLQKLVKKLYITDEEREMDEEKLSKDEILEKRAILEGKIREREKWLNELIRLSLAVLFLSLPPLLNIGAAGITLRSIKPPSNTCSLKHPGLSQ